MILAALVVIAALAAASYEMWRRRGAGGDGHRPETGDAPPLIYGRDPNDDDPDGDGADGGDGGGDA